jgi:hypothetical protein
LSEAEFEGTSGFTPGVGSVINPPKGDGGKGESLLVICLRRGVGGPAARPRVSMTRTATVRNPDMSCLAVAIAGFAELCADYTGYNMCMKPAA